MKHIPLTNSSKQATVDDEDFDYLMQWTWFETEDGYAARLDPDAGIVYMHHEVWNRAHPDQPVW